MAQAQTLRVVGLTELSRDLRKADKEAGKELRAAGKRAAEPVRREWATTFSRIDAFSASKLRARSTQRGAFVDQPLRKTTGNRPDFARLQQRYGEAALERNRAEVQSEYAEAVDELADIVEGKRL